MVYILSLNQLLDKIGWGTGDISKAISEKSYKYSGMKGNIDAGKSMLVM